MGLRFYFGPSDEEKSKILYRDIIQKSKDNPDTNYLILVPDQFTMQTQKELVTMHPDGGILNIDVLSFGRLSHRILEEVGKKEIPVLDDTGKSLVLQKVAAELKEELPVLGGLLHKQGYIHEVKSAISEFMQYGIGTEDVQKLVEFAKKRGALYYKLKDLETLYKGFKEYISGHFITAEETMDVLRRSLSKSKIVKGSVIVLDGFTGFTPIQNRLIQELMVLAKETIVSLTLGTGENPYERKGEQELFYLSKKTVSDLEKLAEEARVSRDSARDVYLTGREEKSKEMLYLQSALFRYEVKPFQDVVENVHIFEATDPKEEVRQTGLFIRELVQEKGLAYRDIAVVSGNLEGYATYVENEFRRMEIPCFVDRTKELGLNPMIELIKSGLELYLKDFSYEAVFHYLRSGLSGIDTDSIDRLENYVVQTGIRGYRAYSRLFTRKPAHAEDEEALAAMNDIRERFIGQVEVLHGKNRDKVINYVNQMYDYLVQAQIQEKLAEYENYFTEQGDLSRAKEYAQIYRLVMELLNQIYELLGEEEITLQEFADILEAGFGEIEVGMIPQNVDRVLVGDIERTRLRSVKVLFFMGVNDGNIPKNASKGGIISDMDREFLQESELELAPTPRQQMYIQRFYLYLNMHKPTQGLYVSYARMGSDGKSLRPAYLIDTLKKMYPKIEVEYPQNRRELDKIVNPATGLYYLAQNMREYVQGTLQKDQKKDFFTLYDTYRRLQMDEELNALEQAAFYRYEASPISKLVAQAIYGTQLENSVTRLETFAACAYKHFLQYGLSLQERKEFGFEAVDMGNIYHGILESFADRLKQKQYTWFDFPAGFAEEAVADALESYAATYGDTVLYSSARNAYMITRMKRILVRTVLTLQQQIKQGTFVPESYEVSFHSVQDLNSVRVQLSENEKMYLRGRIDRVDIAETKDRVYVKVIDYKSGDKQFDLAALYYGLQLQLVVYMNAALEMEAKKHPDKEVLPAAMLYYHVADPVIQAAGEPTSEELNEQILEQLRTKGVVNSDPAVVEMLDQHMEEKSRVIPVGKKKDGSFTANSSVMSAEEMQMVSDYVNRKMAAIGREILNGEVEANPYAKGAKGACDFCPYAKVCHFKPDIPGCHPRKLTDYSKEELLQKMQEE